MEELLVGCGGWDEETFPVALKDQSPVYEREKRE